MKGIITPRLVKTLDAFEDKMTNIALAVSLTLFLGCADPISFEQGDNPIIVVDARLSTQEGETLVEIFKKVGNDKKNIEDFDVNIIDSNGSSLQLEYSTINGGYILPSTTSAQIGEIYFLNARHPDGYQINSGNDWVDEDIDFNLIVKDTIYRDNNAENEGQIADVIGKAIQVKMQPEKEQYYAVISYQNTYEEFYTKEVRNREEYDFLYLFSCENKNCDVEITETIKLERNVSWLFVKKLDTCRLKFNSGECPSEGCCVTFDDYETQMKVTVETISHKNYQFWKEIERLRSNDGLVFDIFPFKFESNVTCENCPFDVIGNFRVTSRISKTKSIFL